MTRNTSVAALVLLGAALLSSCMEQAAVKILAPAQGAMLPGGTPVAVEVEADADEVLISSLNTPPQTVSGDEHFSATVKAADGLGFMVAAISGDELIAVRSWHQGSFRRPRDWHSDSLSLRLGAGALSSGKVSVASLIAQLLQGEQLAPYVKNPMTVTIGVVPATVKVKSVKATKVMVAIKLGAAGLKFLAQLTEVKVDYDASAALVFSTSGTATYASVQVTGDVELAPGKVLLSKVSTTASKATIVDSGGLPIGGVQALTGLFDVDITRAVADAAARAAQRVFLHLLKEIRPTVGISFKKPIVQDTALEQVAVRPTAVELWYKTRIAAAKPAVAAASQQVLARSFVPPGALPSGLAALCGSGLVNQFGFAVWDAGNLDGIAFSRGELEQLGMEQLSFPYSNLERATVGLHLPPLLAWDAGGPRLEVGGVQARIEVSSADDVTAWTAASVPVKLVKVSGGLRLTQDLARKVSMRKVGFDQMHTLADQQEVLRILDTAVPGVIGSVFGSLPTIRLPQIQITRLGGGKGPLLVPVIKGVKAQKDHWLLELELTTR